MVPNSILLTESSEGTIVELCAIVRNKSVWDAEPGNDVSLDELSCVSISNFSQRLGFNPFCEIISGTRRYFLLVGARGKGLTMSNPQCANGHGLAKGSSSLDGFLRIGENL